jgi:hypothetical protein
MARKRKLKKTDAYQKSFDIYQDMKGKGRLNGADASKPDELANESPSVMLP